TEDQNVTLFSPVRPTPATCESVPRVLRRNPLHLVDSLEGRRYVSFRSRAAAGIERPAGHPGSGSPPRNPGSTDVPPTPNRSDSRATGSLGTTLLAGRGAE